LCFEGRGADCRLKLKGKNKKSYRPPGVAPGGHERAIVEQVIALAEPVCESQGLELVHVEYQRESVGRILRLYIDRTGGATIDDCVELSRQMSDLLDVHLDTVGPYSLEVTSPGVDRPLAKKADFERFKGNRARIKTARPYEGRKNFQGILLGMSGDTVQLSTGEEKVAIYFDDIVKARLVDYDGES
jgi:ribosome maturation factor RimP